MAFLPIACVDTEARLDEFVSRLPHGSGGGPSDGGMAGSDALVDSGTCPPVPGALDGPYVLTLAASIAPTTPIMTLLDLTTPDYMGGTGFAFDARALSAADRKTPIGDPISAGPVVVEANGHYRLPLSGVSIPGAANPISGSDIAVDLELSGNLCGPPESFCGTFNGEVSQPIQLPLDGSTFTLRPVVNGDIPEPPPIDCAGNLADPL